MDEQQWLAQRFEENRSHLRAVAYRMLGTLNEADDAVQEAWLRLSRADTSDVENLAGWLTTVVARLCLDRLRTRKSRGEQSLDDRVPEPLVSRADEHDPEHAALLADAVGLALLVVLDTLPPAERLAFVLHDMFAVPFDEIALLVERTPTATRQLASRARRRVQQRPAAPDTDLDRQRDVVDAFLAASRQGDFEALLEVLDPEVILRFDRGAAGGFQEFRGAKAVTDLGLTFAADGWVPQPVLVNGAAGIVITYRGRAYSVIGFTVRHGKIVAIDILADQARLRELDLPDFDDKATDTPSTK